MLAFAAVLLLQVEVLLNRPVNWDEYFHLTEAHMFQQGRLTETLQVLYARAFFWLALLPVDAVDQIRIARVFMLGFELFTTWAIFALACRFANRPTAMVTALAYLSGGYVFQHGMSFRADPMAAAFLMGTLYILLTRRLDWRWIMLAGCLTGLAFLTTIKIVLYAPAFAAVAWLRWCDSDDRAALIRHGLGYTAATLAFCALFVGLTALTLPPESAADVNAAHQRLSTSGTMMFDLGLFPNWAYALSAIAMAPIMAVMVLRSPFDLPRAVADRRVRIALLLMMAPLLSISFYSNSFPYFYAFILPPVMVAAAIGANVMIKRFGLGLITAALVANALFLSLGTPREVLAVQKQVAAAVDQIFPEPVPYFDFPGMVPAFPKANFFMTIWGVRRYWNGLEDGFAQTMADRAVPLLIVNQEPLTRNQTDPDGAWELSPEDRLALRDSFIPHWGPIWVAGKQFTGPQRVQDFVMRTPGTYTVEGGAVRIDGVQYEPGATLELTRDNHRIERLTDQATVLRWGNHLPRPAEPFLGGQVMKDF